MKRIFCYLLLTLFPALSFAQITLNRGSIASSSYLDTISYHVIKEKIIIPVSINGTTYQFILDTGAPFAISQKLYRKIRPQTIGTVNISDANGAGDSARVISVPKLNIGNIAFLNTTGIVFNNTTEKMFGCVVVDGIIGSNMLRNSVLQINSRDKQIVLTNSVKKLSLEKKFSQQLRLTMGQSNPLIKIGLRKGKDKATEELLFDTGAQGFYDMSVRSYRIFKSQTDIMDTIAKGYGSNVWGMNGLAGKQRQFLLNIPKLEVGKATFQNVIVETTNDSTSRIGASILKYGITTLDYHNQRFYFRPYENINTGELSERPWPVEPTLKNDKMVVGIIWNPALRTEINLGDEILQSGNINYSQMSFCELVESEANKSQDKERKLLLRDARTGKTKTVEINRM